MFGLFNKYKLRDKVFKTDAYKWDFLINDIKKHLESDAVVIITGHFKKTLDKLQETLEKNAIKFEKSKNSIRASDIDLQKMKNSGIASIMHFDETNSFNNNYEFKGAKKETLIIIMIEHHPVPDQDNTIFSFANALPCKSEIICYTSLEEPFMCVFGGDRIISLMDRLGIQDECIENSALSGSIKSAQKKIKSQSYSNDIADSAENWFSYNCPSLSDKIN